MSSPIRITDDILKKQALKQYKQNQLNETIQCQFGGSMKYFNIVNDFFLAICGFFITFHNISTIDFKKSGIFPAILPIFGSIFSILALCVDQNFRFIVQKYYFLGTYMGKSMFCFYMLCQWLVIVDISIDSQSGWLILNYEICIGNVLGIMMNALFACAYDASSKNDNRDYKPNVYLVSNELNENVPMNRSQHEELNYGTKERNTT